jgi:hypothetical protein
MSEKRAVSGWNLIGLATLVLAPGVVLYLGSFEAPDPIRALLFGITIIGAALRSGSFVPLLLPAGAYWWDVPRVHPGGIDGPG